MARAAAGALAACRLHLRDAVPRRRQCRGRRDRLSGERMGAPAARADRPHPRTRWRRCSTSIPTSRRFIDDIVRTSSAAPPGLAHQTVTVETPNSLLQIIATSAPFAMIQMFFAVLVIFFFLSGWTRMRKRTITGRSSFDGAMTTARVIQQVVDATSTYLGTITMVNIGMGAGGGADPLAARHAESPLMWGGIVAVLNYIPYLGPIASAVLLALGGLMTLPRSLVRAAAGARLHRRPPRRGQYRHPDRGRPPAHHQPADDPARAELLGLGVGDDRGAARGAAADHLQDRSSTPPASPTSPASCSRKAR